MMAKRCTDVLVACAGLLLLLPVFALIAVTIKLESRGPVFYRQVRIGRFGRPFRIIKFRSMVANAGVLGPELTVSGDPRITRVGQALRRYKLDELPQLLNVLMGDMSVVGPRPEVPKYAAMYPAGDAELVLSVRPGLTDPASIELRSESELLAGVSDPLHYYVHQLMPHKLAVYRRYIETQSPWQDLRIMALTMCAIIFGSR